MKQLLNLQQQHQNKKKKYLIEEFVSFNGLLNKCL